ncbi:MAG: DUF3175 domain-containing protein [Thermodesulfobacteriota bacterium]
MAAPAKKRAARRATKEAGGRRTRDRARGAAGSRAKREDGSRWSARVTRQSNALDLEPGVFKHDDPLAVARSLKRSADRSTRRKSDPYRSAMSMLTFYLNRAGRNLDARQRRVLERAKDELRRLFGREKKAG